MRMTNLAFAAALALSPAVAGAVTYGGGFNSGGVLDTEHDIDASGFQNDAIIRASVADIDVAFSQSWTFAAVENLLVSGVGTVRQAGFLSGLEILFNGASVALVPGAVGSDTFSFPTVGLAAGEGVVVTVSWDDFTGLKENDSSTITFDLTTESVTAPVPLPAAGWMLIGALGGLGLLTRNRRANA